MIQIAIVDDDSKSLEKIHTYIDRYFTKNAEEYHITEFHDGSEVMDQYEAVYDLIFLDIQMEQADGMKTARYIRKRDQNTVIIFVTQMAKYAIKGYEVDALDFIVKPVDYYGFEIKMRKAVNYIHSHSARKICIDMDGSYLWISTDSIYYIEVFDHDLIYHTENGDYKARGSISALTKQLEGLSYRQCNRCYLVNMKHVTGLEGDWLTVGGTSVKISKRRRKELVDALMRYYGGVL